MFFPLFFFLLYSSTQTTAMVLDPEQMNSNCYREKKLHFTSKTCNLDSRDMSFYITHFKLRHIRWRLVQSLEHTWSQLIWNFTLGNIAFPHIPASFSCLNFWRTSVFLLLYIIHIKHPHFLPCCPTSVCFTCHILLTEVVSILLHIWEQESFQTIVSFTKLWALALIWGGQV